MEKIHAVLGGMIDFKKEIGEDAILGDWVF